MHVILVPGPTVNTLNLKMMNVSTLAGVSKLLNYPTGR